MKDVTTQALPMVGRYISIIEMFSHYLCIWFFTYIINPLVGADEGEKGEGSDITCCEEGGRKPISKDIRHPDCFDVQIPRNDPFYSRLRQTCMEFVRSMPAERPECNLGPREQVIF